MGSKTIIQNGLLVLTIVIVQLCAGHLRKIEDESTYSEIKNNWFTQILDHFNPSDNRTWNQRYFINSDYYSPSTGGPVFLMIGGEGAASKKRMVNSTMIEYAKHFGALCFCLEHRYYGESHPTQDTGVRNVQYLSSQQALADISMFVVAMNAHNNLPSDTQWVAFGGSYAGSLAAWARLKYPHLIKGVVSSGAPLAARVDFKEYIKVVFASIRRHSQECLDTLKKGILIFDSLLTTPNGQAKLNEDFKLCHPIEESVNNRFDLSNLFYTITEEFNYVVQYNSSSENINQVCDIMINKTNGSPLDRLAIAVKSVSVFKDCLSYKYDEMIEKYQNVTWQPNISAGRPWLYQACTEFGFYETSSLFPHVFRDYFKVDFFAQRCMDILGKEYDLDFINRAAERTNAIYGGLKINITNVVYIHGSTDPWQALGLAENVNSHLSAGFLIPDMAHCADMNVPTTHDSDSLKRARLQTIGLIEKWTEK